MRSIHSFSHGSISTSFSIIWPSLRLIFLWQLASIICFFPPPLPILVGVGGGGGGSWCFIVSFVLVSPGCIRYLWYQSIIFLHSGFGIYILPLWVASLILRLLAPQNDWIFNIQYYLFCINISLFWYFCRILYDSSIISWSVFSIL